MNTNFPFRSIHQHIKLHFVSVTFIVFCCHQMFTFWHILSTNCLSFIKTKILKFRFYSPMQAWQRHSECNIWHKPSLYLGLSVGEQRGGGGMAGETARWRRGRQIRYRWEHQIHPPRSHPQADTQVASPSMLCIHKPIVLNKIIQLLMIFVFILLSKCQPCSS